MASPAFLIYFHFFDIYHIASQGVDIFKKGRPIES